MLSQGGEAGGWSSSSRACDGWNEWVGGEGSEIRGGVLKSGGWGLEG